MFSLALKCPLLEEMPSKPNPKTDAPKALYVAMVFAVFVLEGSVGKLEPFKLNFTCGFSGLVKEEG